MGDEPQLLEQLRANVKELCAGVDGIKGLKVTSDDCSPTVHVRLAASDGGDEDDDDAADTEHQEEQLQEIARHALGQKGGLVCLPSKAMPREKVGAWRPSLRMTVSAAHTKAQLRDAIGVLSKAAKAVL